MSVVRLTTEVREALETLLRAGYPSETCGVMVGHSADSRTEVQRIVQARNLNVERAADRYELDPEDFMAADHAAREEGMEIVGIWHSHPDHPARPSETDRVAAWEGWSYVIASVTRDGIADVRSWRLNGENFVEETIES